MFQKQFLLRQYQNPYQQNHQNQSKSNKAASFSPKIEYTNLQKKPLNSPRFQQNHQNVQNNLKPSNQVNDQPSQSYESYYQQKINMTNSISVGQSHPSKHSRTQKSRDKVKALQQIKEEQQNILMLKKKYSTLMREEGSKMSSNNLAKNYSKDRANKLVSGMNPSMNSESYDKKLIKSHSKNHRHLKTENSRDKNLRNQATYNQEGSNTYQHVQNSNTNNNNTYSRSINNSFSPRFYQNEQSQTDRRRMMSPSQEYYSVSYQNNTSNNQTELSRQVQVHNHRLIPPQSRDASTVNTQQRPSSLSLNKFAKKPMLTFYHCEIKKFYQYNDQGYLTNRQIILRQKVEKAAEQALDKLIIEQEEQSESSKLQKSKSVGHFPKLNQLKQEAEKQRKRKYELYGKYQNQISKQTESNGMKTISGSKQKSYNPSQLPPSSSLSKKKFNVIYKEDGTQNILSKHQINDDSYHDRQEKKKQSHIQQVTQNARSSIVKKNMEKKSKISQHSSSKKDNSFSDYEMKVSKNKLPLNEQSPKGISKIGGITSQYMISSNQNVSNTIHQSKPSFVEEFSESSISENVNNSNQNSVHKLSNNSKKKITSNQQKELVESKKSSEEKEQNSSFKSKQSQNSQNLDMINSNYKKVFLTEQELQLNISENGSLKLKTNTDKNKKDLPIETHQLKVNPNRGSVTSEQDFESDSFIKKQSSNSVKSSHIGLTKEPHNNKKTKSSKLSNYGSQSVIQTNLKKKSSLKKWVRQNSFEESENILRAETNMKKKDKAEIAQSIPNLKSSKEENQKNPRLSVDSNCLRIDSTVNLQTSDKKQRRNSSKIQQQSQSSKSQKYNGSKNSISKNQLNSSKPKSKKLSSQSEGSLLAYSQHHIKQTSKLSNEMKKSRLSMQRQSHKSKTQSHTSRNSHVKIMMGKQTQQKSIQSNTHKFGNLLKVDYSKQSINSQQSNSESRAKSQNSPHDKKPKQSINNSQRSQYLSHQQQEFSSSHEIGFNLIQRAQQLLQIEDQLHERRRKLQNDDEMTEDFQDVLAKIEAHISIIREILQTATTAMDIYSQDSAWVFKSCLLSLKKYQLERIKIVETLRGKKSCFKIAQNQLAEQDLKQFLTDEEIKLLADHMEHCNGLNEKMIEDFVTYLREYFGEEFSQSQFNLRPFDDRFDLGILLEEYRTEILGLREKAGPSQSPSPQKESQQEVLEEETEELIKKRIFKLMEVSFLLSELAGKRIKEFTEEIDIQDQFEEYYSDYWPYFERIVKTFS